MNSRKIVITALCVLASVAGSYGYQHYEKARSKERFATNLAEAARLANQSTPRMIDEYTRLDGASVKSGSILAMHYTVPSIKQAELDTSIFRKETLAMATKQICGSAEAVKFLKFGGLYEFTYVDGDGREITRFHISHGLCG